MTRTSTPVLVLLAAGVVLAAAASAMLVRSIVDYIENPLAISSTSGNVVFALPDGYVSYKPFEVGFEATLVCIALGAPWFWLLIAKMRSPFSLAATEIDAGSGLPRLKPGIWVMLAVSAPATLLCSAPLSATFDASSLPTPCSTAS